ncbi:MAG: YggS family pyridoxal phosphate-dependent enzyme [Clostridiales Family XIII bacterium]|jgi:pyridoxal phosphate enzyme (YggS family)|nr:YggS family pyridoxal phosphate-dependent enzyme [Clostridiales Family XIII bacterium]
MGTISENIAAVKEQIGHYAELSGRGPGDVLLVAVTKTRSADEINAAIEAGITDIGENKVQEIIDKHDAALPVNWHMIGHLQRNKVKYIIDKVKMIHSVDSFRLAEEIDRRAGSAGIAMDILIQVNAANEESKFGAAAQDTEGLLREILDRCANIRVRGLMSIAPIADDPGDVAVYFRQVKALYDGFMGIRHERLDLKYISMGMSHDFGVAIREGANIVRIGSAIFGPRAAPVQP